MGSCSASTHTAASPAGTSSNLVGIARAGNRVILAYKLVADVPPPRHQPARDLLVAVNAPYDGGWFADSLAGGPDEALAVVTRYLADPALREMLPVTRR